MAVVDTLVATEDTAVTYAAADLLDNDTDANSGDTLSIKSVTAGTGGTVALNADGSVTFTPAANFNGAASFSYVVTDGKGGDSQSTTVTVNVTPVNDAPVAVADTANAIAGQLVSIDVLVNDTDVDNADNGNAGLTIKANSLMVDAAQGTAVINNGKIDFTPAAGFSGSATITYVVSDGATPTAGEATGTATVTVAAPVVTFTATESNGLITFGGTATGAISLVVNADGSATFTREGVTASMAIASIAAKVIDAPNGISTFNLTGTAGNDTLRFQVDDLNTELNLTGDLNTGADRIVLVLPNDPDNNQLLSFNSTAMLNGADDELIIAFSDVADVFAFKTGSSINGYEIYQQRGGAELDISYADFSPVPQPELIATNDGGAGI